MAVVCSEEWAPDLRPELGIVGSMLKAEAQDELGKQFERDLLAEARLGKKI